MKKFSLFFLLVLLQISCNKTNDETPVTEPEPPQNKLEVVWQEALYPDSLIGYSMQPVVHDNDIVFSRSDFEHPEVLMKRDGETGELIWEWGDPDFTKTVNSQSQYVHEDLLALSTWDLFVFDLAEGKFVWKSELQTTDANIDGKDNHVYQSYRNGGTTTSTLSTLRRSPVNHAEWEDIFSVEKTNDYRPHLYPPAVTENTEGEELLIFQNRSYNFTIGAGKVDLYCFNTATNEVEWVHEDIEPRGKSSVYTPIISEDLVYFQGARTIFCYRISTGELIWSRNFSAENEMIGFSQTPMLLDEDKLFVNASDVQLYAFDKYTGETVWSHTNIKSENSRNMLVHNGYLYFISGGRGLLFALDKNTGRIEWEERSPNDDTYNGLGFRSGIAVNRELNLLYTTDGGAFMAIRCLE